MLSRQTQRDDTLEHQVKFFMNNGKIAVTCNCKATVGDHSKAGKIWYQPMDYAKDLSGAREIYNDPRNHNGDPLRVPSATW